MCRTMPGLSASAATGDDQLDGTPAQFDLEFILFDGVNTMRGVLRYDAQLFDRATAKRLVSQWKRLLDEFSAYPGDRIAQADIGEEVEG